jgi:hypothetical protein
MPKNQVSDLITDQEIAFAHLILSGTMTDSRAAAAVGLNPDTAAYTKAKPRVRAYMLEHRAAVHERLVQQEIDEVRRLNLGRDQVLARLWEIANLDPESTRNSMSAQIKALSMIVAIEGLIPDRHSARRAVSAQNVPASPLIDPQIDTSAWLREQQGKTTVPQPSPDLDQDGPGAAADEPSDLGPTSGPDLDLSEPVFVHPLSPSETTPSAPHARSSAADNRVASAREEKPFTWRLRL